MPSQPAYRALSDPTRRAILWLLHAGDRPALDIATVLDAPPAVVRRHLDLLTAAGLVRLVAGSYTLRASVLDDIVLELAQLAGIPVDLARADPVDPADPTHRTAGTDAVDLTDAVALTDAVDLPGSTGGDGAGDGADPVRSKVAQPQVP